LEDLVARAAVFHILPGWLVILLGVIFNFILVVIAYVTDKSRVEEIRRKVADKKELE
jgi:putative exporter of polyketide antibiotics